MRTKRVGSLVRVILGSLLLLASSDAAPEEARNAFIQALERISQEERRFDLQDTSLAEAIDFVEQVFRERLSQIAEADTFPSNAVSKWRLHKVASDTRLDFVVEQAKMVDVMSRICTETDLQIIVSPEGMAVIPSFVKIDSTAYRKIAEHVYLRGNGKDVPPKE